VHGQQLLQKPALFPGKRNNTLQQRTIKEQNGTAKQPQFFQKETNCIFVSTNAELCKLSLYRFCANSPSAKALE
jgi:hypothetical protein